MCSGVQTADPPLPCASSLAHWVVGASSSCRSQGLWNGGAPVRETARGGAKEWGEEGVRQGWMGAGERISRIQFQHLGLEPASQTLPDPPFSYCLHALLCGCHRHTQPLASKCYICSPSLIWEAASHTCGAASLSSERQMTRELFVVHMPSRL